MKRNLSLRRFVKSDDFLFYLLALLLPILSMICIFAGNAIYPFGDRSFLRTDLYHQYAPFFAELSRKLKEGESLFYTWNIGMGTNFLSLIGYYLSSVFNWLILLCPQDHVIEFISYLVIFKLGLAGLSFSILLKEKNGAIDFKIPFFGLFYALSGYTAAYNWNIMWLDCIWLAPLILLGIERLVHQKKYLLYIITLAMAIISNYYIAIMLCIFCVLYFLMQLIQLWVKKTGTMRQACVRFALSSLTAGALSAFILLPEMKALGLTASSDINFPTEWTEYFGILEMLARHLINVVTECGLDHWPNIYCGVGVLLCIPLYYLNKKISANEKFTKTALLLFMLFSFSLNVPNFIWHGLHYPNSLPCRQSFLYIAIVLVMCYEGIQNLDEISEKHAGMGFAIGTAFIVLCQTIITDDAFDFSSYWLSLLFLLIYAVILFAYIKKRWAKEILFLLLLITVTTEAIINTAVTSVTTVSRSEYLKYSEEYGELINLIQERDDDFYRFEKVARKTKNDGAFVGYPSLSTFSSVSYGAVSDFYKNLGMESSTNAYCNNGITPLMNSLFGVKYILATVTQQESQLMQLCEQNELCYIYENLYTMSAGFMLPKGFNLDWNTEIGTPIDVQNEFSNLIIGEDLFYQIYDYSESGDTMHINVSETCHVYVRLDSTSIEEVTADINGDTTTFTRTERGFLLDLGYCSPEDTITLTAADDVSMSGTPYYFNESAFIDLIKLLKEQELQVTEYSDTAIEGTIDVKEDGLFFLSIAYDPGWKLYVDGVETEYYKFQEAFICLDLDEGEHEIKMTYTPDGFVPGMIISIGALILLIGFEVGKRRGLIKLPAVLERKLEAGPSDATHSENPGNTNVSNSPENTNVLDEPDTMDNPAEESDSPDLSNEENSSQKEKKTEIKTETNGG